MFSVGFLRYILAFRHYKGTDNNHQSGSGINTGRSGIYQVPTMTWAIGLTEAFVISLGALMFS